MDREELRGRYRRLREINNRQQTDALAHVPRITMLDCARRLGLAQGRTLVLDNPDEMSLICDLVVYGGKTGRSRAIDRYAARLRPAPGSDDELMLTAALNAKFAMWRVERRHEVLGIYVLDIFSNETLWLIDESLEASCPSGQVLAGRLMTIGDFAITCGVAVPIDVDVITEAWEAMPRWSAASRAEMAQDPRFATGIFRAALRTGAADRVQYVNPAEVDQLEPMAID
jgi:hypothetical protein